MKAHSFLTVFLYFCFLSIGALFAAPVVTSVTPYFGPSSGGTVVSIMGSGFTGASTVFFGETPVSPTIINDIKPSE